MMVSYFTVLLALLLLQPASSWLASITRRRPTFAVSCRSGTGDGDDVPGGGLGDTFGELGSAFPPGSSPISSSFIPTVNTFDPDKINSESFHGFLKSEFESMSGGDARGKISFIQFYKWKSKNGLVFAEEEVHDLWEDILDEREALCDLERFIKLNFIIDEQ